MGEKYVLHKIPHSSAYRARVLGENAECFRDILYPFIPAFQHTFPPWIMRHFLGFAKPLPQKQDARHHSDFVCGYNLIQNDTHIFTSGKFFLKKIPPNSVERRIHENILFAAQIPAHSRFFESILFSWSRHIFIPSNDGAGNKHTTRVAVYNPPLQ